MKVSHPKRSRWLYLGLGLMLTALILFSVLPLATTIWQQTQINSSTATSSETGRRLESQALGYQMVLEREPNNLNALQGLLETRLQQGDLAKALIPLEQLAQLQPEQIQYSILLAQSKQQLKDEEGAASIYRHLLAKKPDSLPALKGLSDLRLAQNRPQEAIAAVQAAITQSIQAQVNSSSPEKTTSITSLQLLLGEIYLQQQRPQEAIALYTAAHQLNPQDFRPVLAQAMVLKQQKQDSQAKPLFDKAVGLAPVEYKDLIKQMALPIPAGPKPKQ